MKFDEKKIVDDVLAVMPSAVEIWFHGSRARGDNKRNSDWDILVLHGDDLKAIEAYELLRPLNPPRRLDDRRRAELDIQADDIESKNRSASVAYWACREGRLLYSAPEPEPDSPKP